MAPGDDSTAPPAVSESGPRQQKSVRIAEGHNQNCTTSLASEDQQTYPRSCLKRGPASQYTRDEFIENWQAVRECHAVVCRKCRRNPFRPRIPADQLFCENIANLDNERGRQTSSNAETKEMIHFILSVTFLLLFLVISIGTEANEIFSADDR